MSAEFRNLSLILLTCAAVTFSIAKPDASNPGPQNGFRTLKWGDPPTSDMERVPEEARNSNLWPETTEHRRMDLYRRAEYDDLAPGATVAGADAGYILYYYFRNSLCAVTVIWTDLDEQTYSGIIRTLSLTWGTPDVQDKYRKREWRSRDQSTAAAIDGSSGKGPAVLKLQDEGCFRRVARANAGV